MVITHIRIDNKTLLMKITPNSGTLNTSEYQSVLFWSNVLALKKVTTEDEV